MALSICPLSRALRAASITLFLLMAISLADSRHIAAAQSSGLPGGVSGHRHVPENPA
jgi:hypothetical protein